MSLNGSSGNSTNRYESLGYDADFAAQIGAKMQVPDKIYMADGLDNVSNFSSPPEEVKAMMFVPDRILLAGDNQHIAMRESVPELKFDSDLSHKMPSYMLPAPPSVLTIDEYPSLEFKPPRPEERSCAPDRTTGDPNESSLSYAPEEEVAMLRRQVRNLSRRLLALEQDGQQRQQREVILYALGVTYFLLKGLFWLHRHF